MNTPTAPYTPEDFIEFNTQFGREVTDAPAIVPAFNNYWHVHSDAGAQGKLGNITLIDGVTMLPPGTSQNYPDIKWQWFIDDVFKTDKPEPLMIDLKPECDGVVKIKLIVTHLPTQVSFTREEWGYLQYTYLEDCPDDPDKPSQFDVFYDYYPNVNPYETWAKLKWDLTGDGKVNTQDLLKFLPDYNVLSENELDALKKASEKSDDAAIDLARIILSQNTYRAARKR